MRNFNVLVKTTVHASALRDFPGFLDYPSAGGRVHCRLIADPEEEAE
jgi:hypothetical protein